MHMNNGQFEALHVDDPEIACLVYNKLLDNRRGSANPTTCGVKSWVRSSWYCVKIYPKSFVQCATGGKMMMLSVVLSIGLQLAQDDTEEISIRAKTRTNERHDETSERGRVVRYSKSKPDDFLRAKYEHDGRFWTDRLPADCLRGWKEGLGLRAVLGACEETASDTRITKRYRHADGRYFGAQLSEDLVVGNDNSGIAPFVRCF